MNDADALGLSEGLLDDFFSEADQHLLNIRQAMTGYGMEEDIEKCLVSGFVAHLVKPVKIRALENALASILNRPDQAAG